jgi:CDP-glycerol glycerophosphotransferase (TagB/SpsB family)/glycosyltransferase involved in cell wall biosynthesis
VGWLLRKAKETWPVEYRAWSRTQPIDPDLVLYESFAGNGMLDNPEAIFRALLADPEEQHRTHVWALDDLSAHPTVMSEFHSDPRVRFVRRGSFGYSRALATAGLLINNATFPSEFGKRPGQTYVNTWHGTPLKAMGYDEPDGAVSSRNVLRNFMMADYLLSSSAYMSERMYEQAYRLTNVATARIIEEGLPRTDRQVLDDAGRSEVCERLRRRGVTLGEKDRIVLYAPTWRGRSFHAPAHDAHDLASRAAELESLLPRGHRVLLKTHQQVAQAARADPTAAGRLVPNDFPTNLLLGVVDVLVTDYSSVMFDFLATGRPLVLFTPDLDAYQTERGLYLDPAELPGPVLATVEEVAEVVGAVGTGGPRDPQTTHGRAYAAARRRFAPYDDGSVTQRVLDVVLRHGPESSRVRSVKRDERPTLLIHLGGLTTNGITSSALNLLRAIDHDAFDVSIIRNHSVMPERVANVSRIDPRVRQFVRVGGMAMSRRHYLARRRLLSGRGASLGLEKRQWLDGLLRAEWSRTVGQARFDHIIDFSGYSPLWAYLISTATAGTRSIWLHNDLKADQMRTVGGRHPHEDNLRGVFSAYSRFDRLVSVSSALREVNASRLAEWAPAERFVAARNVIDHERVLASAQMIPDPAILRFMSGSFIFVTVGRLSPEKNHLRLMEAFAEVHRERTDTRLVVIGSGPMLEAITMRISRLGLSDAVVLTGTLANPWALMARCNCLVVSSDYEGQPMTILEARALRLPVVATDFASAASALPDGEGLIVPRTPGGLARGMLAARAGEVPHPPFDPVAYNAVVVNEFYAAIGAAAVPSAFGDCDDSQEGQDSSKDEGNGK